MKKLWIIAQTALSPRDSGGTRHFSLARELNTQGFDVTIVGEAGRHTPGLEVIDGVKFFRLDGATSKRSYVHRLAGMLGFARALQRPIPLEKPDIILASSPPLFAADGAYRLARRLKVPFVLEVADLWPESLVEIAHISTRHPVVIWMNRIARKLYRHADHVVTLFPESVPYLVQRGVPAARITALPNGMDPTMLGAPEAHEAQGEFQLYYLGAMGPPNALEVVIEAAHLLQQRGAAIKVHMVGDGVSKPALMARAAGLQNLTFSPPIPKQEISATLVRADAFILSVRDLPLYRLGLSPNKLYDYLYAARPILYAGGFEPAVLVQHKVGVYCTADAASIADGAERLAALPAAERQAMGERGRAYVLAYHDYRKLGTQLAATLKQL